MGFIATERFDFGSGKDINLTFYALLGVKPFSTQVIITYDSMLRYRTLLIHHGGIYTLTDVKQLKISGHEQRDSANLDSLVITKEYVINKINFIDEMARKLLMASHRAVISYVEANGISIGPQRQKAIDAFLRWDDDRT